jgi:peptidoglycan-associated lipoprotein
MMKMKTIMVILVAVLVAGCAPRINQPTSLPELEGGMENTLDNGSGMSSDLTGPTDAGLAGDSTEGWNDFSGGTELTNRPQSADWSSDSNLETVYFDYDKYELSAEAQRALVSNANYLQRNPSMRLLLEGHCDERGTDQYNQALGENRALAVREYLIQLGIDASRIDVISYGELRPSVEGHDESTWRWNRRAEFKVAG